MMKINRKYILNSKPRQGRLIFPLIFSLLIFCLDMPGFCFGQGASNSIDAEVKAAFIYKFTKFIYWNQSEYNERTSPVIISVLGADPVADYLEDFSKRQPEGRSFELKKIKKIAGNLSVCNLLFISRLQQHQLPVILKMLEGANVVTVSDIPGFARLGGIIGFVVEDDRVKLEINLRAAKKAGLKISAKLLEIARIVEKAD